MVTQDRPAVRLGMLAYGGLGKAEPRIKWRVSHAGLNFMKAGYCGDGGLCPLPAKRKGGDRRGAQDVDQNTGTVIRLNTERDPQHPPPLLTRIIRMG
jgi:hypothetical protein